MRTQPHLAADDNTITTTVILQKKDLRGLNETHNLHGEILRLTFSSPRIPVVENAMRAHILVKDEELKSQSGAKHGT